MTMYTFCPNCHTLYSLSARHLAKAGGQTRCGECRQAYSAVDYLFEDLAVAREAQQLHLQQPEDTEETTAQEPLLDTADTADTADLGYIAPDYPESPPLQMPAGGWSQSSFKMPDMLSGVAIVLLVSFMAVQWVLYNRAELAGEPGWRPGLEKFCETLHCSLPLQVDLAQLELVNRDVRQHPRVEEALLVNATLANRADFAQPYPVLEVSFTDLGGNPVAVRRFRPNEYVIDSYTIERGMLPGEPVPVVLEIVDPGEVAASYQFGFL